MLNSLRLNYGYDGGPELLARLEEYFDTAEHAAFAIQLATNPHWLRTEWPEGPGRLARFELPDNPAASYARVRDLLEKHSGLFQGGTGASSLTLLAMRTALRMGNPAAAARIGEAVPAEAAVRGQPDFHWMLGSAYFLTRRYADAEQPLQALFHLRGATSSQRAAAAYGLCGVYGKTGNGGEQLRYALWLFAGLREQGDRLG